MRGVAFLSTMGGVPWAGSEELWSAAALELRSRDVRVCANVKQWSPDPEPVARMERAGCRIFRRPAYSWTQRQIDRILGSRTYRWLDDRQDDLVVISQSCLDGTLWALECHRRRIPYAILVHIAAEYFWPDDDLADLARQAFSNARQCFFVSQATADLTSRQIALPLPDVKLVRNPFNVSFHARPAWPGGEEGLRLACVGRLDPRHKGQDLVLELLAQDKWRGRPVSVTFFGAGSSERSLRRLAEMRGLENVRFESHTSDIEAVWADHHALILPSRVEGLPLVVVEAMLCSRPCIVTDVGGNAEVVDDGVTGFVAAAPMVPFLDHALERCWGQRGRLESMGQAAGARIREFAPENPGRRFAEQLLELASDA